ncbi:MAG: DUF3299 domain-containing protein [Candidatus Cyclonatronum sp.]|uniref:DUF3299 domain-containing protein n=1 Tax=Cyclonatronum sp. TaxID=3024185 RepID=UPI0025BCC862|nr:DUF3299 domain-containing protein [Cyclonatronum sp.]MCC5933054.1 DUF3299 domain-containing protein [Balneolales bacterium]MCH8485727.1 DUF3299 domain-containing protein [Cyclonatronum sp.]
MKTVSGLFIVLFTLSVFGAAPTITSAAVGEAGLSEASSEAPRIMFSDFRRYQIHRQNAAVPEDLKALNGQEISVVGYMVPFDRIENITQFILLQAPFMGCMHVPPPQANETLMIETTRPLATYTFDPLRVTGTLKIDEVYVEGFLVSVYTISNARVSSSSASDAELEGLPDNFHFYGDL